MNDIDPKNFNKILEETRREYEEEIKRMIKEYEELIYYNVKNAIDTIQTEFIYEIASQMKYWNMDEKTDYHKYTKESAKYRIEEIYRNVFKSVEKYSKLSNDKEAQKLYKKKKDKINNEFNLEIKD